MLIKDLSRQTGLPASTIRYYERLELLPAPQRSEAQYRIYSNSDVERLHFIQKAKRLGLSLDNIRQLIAVRQGGTPPCHELKEMVSDRIDELDQKFAELQTLRQDLAAYQTELTRQLVDAASPPPASLCNGNICGFIEKISYEA